MVARPTEPQRQSFERVLSGLHTLGFPHSLVRKGYTYEDWFEEGTPERSVAAAAFTAQPFDYRTACFAVGLSNEVKGVAWVRQVRSLGAPRAFEIGQDGRVAHWRISREPSVLDRQAIIEPDRIEAEFAGHRERWSPDAFSEQRWRPSASQDFIDVGLIPALEDHIRDRLGPSVTSILEEAGRDYAKRTKRPPNPETLYRLLFRGITGKVLRDRQHSDFREFELGSDADEMFRRVTTHYGASGDLGDKYTRRIIYDAIWSGMNLKNLSADVLSFLYEDVLVTPKLRETHGIHATPPSVARYVVQRLPLDDIPEGRTVVEPCCGGAAFLVAALQRFRQTLHRTTTAAKRHEYARSRLFGSDIDAFAREVARCSLTLSDYPSGNGWQIEEEDVFEPESRSPKYHDALRRAKVVLCNPRFEDFTAEERAHYRNPNPRVPVELVHRLLANIPPDACLGLVLPSQAVDGVSYRTVRERLASRFAELELVKLPRFIFRHADLSPVMLLARKPANNPPRVRVVSSSVTDREHFERTGTADETVSAGRPISAIVQTLDVNRFQAAWDHLVASGFPTPSVVHRGVEWNRDFPKADRFSPTSKRGYRLGYHSTEGLSCYELPEPIFLNASEEGRDRKAWDLPWQQPKVLMGRARKSRYPWRLSAAPDLAGRTATENFIAVWMPEGWTPLSLAAALNGPVASAFVHTHDRDQDNKTSTIAKLPLPRLPDAARAELDAKVARYMESAAAYRREVEKYERDMAEHQTDGLFGTARPAAAPTADHLKQLILEIDETVLDGYRLPPPLERGILNLFRGHKRPIPFDFPEYVEELIRRRLAEQTRFLEENPDEQRETWRELKKSLEEDRYKSRKLPT